MHDVIPVTFAESPFGKMPVLDVDGVLLCQSKAIDRLLAKTFGKNFINVVRHKCACRSNVTSLAVQRIVLLHTDYA